MEEMVLEAKEEFNKIIEFVTRDALTWELHSVEGELFRRLLQMGLVLLMLFVRSVCTGHVGPTLTTEEGSVLRYRRTSPRKYLSVFGEVEIRRAYYPKDGGKGVFRLEAQLNLPRRMYSYILQKWMTLCGVKTTYEGAVEFVEGFLVLDLAHRPIQRVARDLKPVVDEFSDLLEEPKANEKVPFSSKPLTARAYPWANRIRISRRPRTSREKGRWHW